MRPRATRFEPAYAVSDIVSALRAYGLSQHLIAEAVGVDVRSVRAWERGCPPRARSERRLRGLQDLVALLSPVLEPAALRGWLITVDRRWSGLRPLDALAGGDVALARRAATALVEERTQVA